MRVRTGSKPGTVEIIIDRGERDMITMDWMVSLLDEQGHPLTPWAPIKSFRWDSESVAEVEATMELAREHQHVGMRIDQQLQDAKIKLTPPGHFH